MSDGKSVNLEAGLCSVAEAAELLVMSVVSVRKYSLVWSEVTGRKFLFGSRGERLLPVGVLWLFGAVRDELRVSPGLGLREAFLELLRRDTGDGFVLLELSRLLRGLVRDVELNRVGLLRVEKKLDRLVSASG
jgi:hypothetical protein